MPSRRLPQWNAPRYKALTVAKELKDAVPPPAIIPLSAPTIVKLDTRYPIYKAKIEAAEAALQAQVAAGKTVNETRTTAEWLLSDFYDNLQRGIRRGLIDSSVRPSYGLAANNSSLPAINTEADISFWGQKAAAGEAARIAAGGAPITFPAIADVTTGVNAFKAANQQQANAKITYDIALETVEAENIETDKLILKMWNEIETTFDEGDKPGTRRKAREWGVVYTIAPGETPSPEEFSITGTFTDSVTGLPISDAVVVVQTPEVIVTTDAQGKYFVPAMAAGSYTMFVHKDGYIEQSLGSVVVTAGAITSVNFQLVPGSSGSTVGKVAGQVQKTSVGASATVSVQGTGISINTDPSGNYILNNVPAGAQVIAAVLTSNPASTQSQNTTVIADGTVIVNFNFP